MYIYIYTYIYYIYIHIHNHNIHIYIYICIFIVGPISQRCFWAMAPFFSPRKSVLGSDGGVRTQPHLSVPADQGWHCGSQGCQAEFDWVYGRYNELVHGYYNGLQVTSQLIESMAMQQEPIDWRYLPYIRPIFQSYIRGYTHKIWPTIWYSTSILGSWTSYWTGHGNGAWDTKKTKR